MRRLTIALAVLTVLAGLSLQPASSNWVRPRTIAAQNDCQTFPETGKSVCGIFLSYWKANGGLAQQGYPISDVFKEQSSNGQTYDTQYFERAVFERHPENAGTKFEVLLALLGSERLKTKYPGGPPAGQAPAPPAPTATTAPRPPTTNTIPVLSSSDNSWSGDTRELVGEVQNNTSRNAERVNIVATFYDSTGRVVATANTYADVDIMRPGQRSPFRTFYDLSSVPARHSIQVQWQGTDKQPIDNIPILSSGNRSHTATTQRVFGEVRNDSGVALRNVSVLITGFSASGQVVAVQDTYGDIDNLSPGAVTPFETFIEKRGATRYEVQTQGN